MLPEENPCPYIFCSLIHREDPLFGLKTEDSCSANYKHIITRCVTPMHAHEQNICC